MKTLKQYYNIYHQQELKDGKLFFNYLYTYSKVKAQRRLDTILNFDPGSNGFIKEAPNDDGRLMYAVMIDMSQTFYD